MDLAGSEQIDFSDEKKKEVGMAINKSVQFLEAYISIQAKSPIPNRDGSNNCALTRILRESLGGNADSLIICFIQANKLNGSKKTLKFAKNASLIKTQATNQPKLTPQLMIQQLKYQLEKTKHDSEKQLKEQDDRHKQELACRDRRYQEELAQRDTPTGVLPAHGNCLPLTNFISIVKLI